MTDLFFRHVNLLALARVSPEWMYLAPSILGVVKIEPEETNMIEVDFSFVRFTGSQQVMRFAFMA